MPAQGSEAPPRARQTGGDALRPPDHLHRRPACEGEEQNPARVRAVAQQVRHAMRQRVCLARARPRDDEQRARARAAGGAPVSSFRGPIDAVAGCLALRGIQSVEMMFRHVPIRGGSNDPGGGRPSLGENKVKEKHPTEVRREVLEDPMDAYRKSLEPLRKPYRKSLIGPSFSTHSSGMCVTSPPNCFM